jgi:hypothetical protein
MPTRDQLAQMIWECNPENDGLTWETVNAPLRGAVANHAASWTAATYAIVDRLSEHPTWKTCLNMPPKEES